MNHMSKDANLIQNSLNIALTTIIDHKPEFERNISLLRNEVMWFGYQCGILQNRLNEETSKSNNGIGINKCKRWNNKI